MLINIGLFLERRHSLKILVFIISRWKGILGRFKSKLVSMIKKMKDLTLQSLPLLDKFAALVLKRRI